MREILRVFFNSPKVFFHNIFDISLLFFLANCHPVRVSDLETLLTVKDEGATDFLRVTQNSKVKAMKLSTLKAPLNSELFWYRFRFLKTDYYLRRNYIRVLEVAHDY